jgi:UDP-N-acetyl-D-mannosaminouronate:lipid I N-acetyl-D-mannosaminouronosyltransferase
LKKKDCKEVVKIPGCELWLKIIEAWYEKGKSFYLVGAQPEVIRLTVEKLHEEYSGINIVGYRDGYIRSEIEKKALLDDIAEKKPDVVFVAMGSPKQELLMEEMQQAHSAVYQGLGGSFDVFVGNVERAPQWWVKHNLEWAYRLIRQPSRISRQIHLVRFWLLIKLGRI